MGRALVRGLHANGHQVRVLDNDSRGSEKTLADLLGKVEIKIGDIRDPGVVREAMEGMDCVCHLAFINGTEFFYEKPELVLEVGIKGMMNVLDACIDAGVKDMVLASSSEVYQVPQEVPTPETVPLIVPDPLNPRYSYGGGKIICELLALNYGRKYFDRTVIFRPHNVYGSQMGWEHVIPALAVRMARLKKEKGNEFDFPIQGTGDETRAFVHIDDFTDGLLRVVEEGKNLEIYHIGTDEEVSIKDLTLRIAESLGVKINIIPGELLQGSAPRRCPDITKLKQHGYKPTRLLSDALPDVVSWYAEHMNEAPKEEK